MKNFLFFNLAFLLSVQVFAEHGSSEIEAISDETADELAVTLEEEERIEENYNLLKDKLKTIRHDRSRKERISAFYNSLRLMSDRQAMKIDPQSLNNHHFNGYDEEALEALEILLPSSNHQPQAIEDFVVKVRGRKFSRDGKFTSVEVPIKFTIQTSQNSEGRVLIERITIDKAWGDIYNIHGISYPEELYDSIYGTLLGKIPCETIEEDPQKQNSNFIFKANLLEGSFTVASWIDGSNSDYNFFWKSDSRYRYSRHAVKQYIGQLKSYFHHKSVAASISKEEREKALHLLEFLTAYISAIDLERISKQDIFPIDHWMNSFEASKPSKE